VDTPGGSSAPALRGLLRLYSPADDAATRKQIEGIGAVSASQVVRRLPAARGPLAFGRGLTTFFGVPASLEQFVGHWLTLDARDHSRLAAPHATLGTGATLVKTVLGDEKTHHVAFELTSTYRIRTYCVQYRETDFNFVSRLLERCYRRVAPAISARSRQFRRRNSTGHDG
jgi:hypothetical protein